jgi:tetratricopeptide (TPR) repeat protein
MKTPTTSQAIDGGRWRLGTAMLLALFGSVLTSPPLPAEQGSAAPTADSAATRAQARAVFQQTLAGLAQNGSRKKAQAGFLRVIALDPGYALPYFNLGLLAEADEDWGVAISDFNRFLTLAPNSAYRLRAQAEIEHATTAKQADSTPQGKLSRQYTDKIVRARALALSGMGKLAVAEAAEAANLDSSRWEAYAVIASALSRQGFDGDAARFLRMAIDRAPADKRPLLERASTSLNPIPGG